MSFTHNIRLAAAALAIGLVLLCNGTERSGGQVDAQQVGRSGQEFGLVGDSSYRVVNFAPSPDSAYFGSGQQATRVRRQVQTPQAGFQPFQQQAQQTGGGVMSYLSELGPQLAQANALTTLLNPQQQGGGGQAGSPTSGITPIVLMGQLSELIRSTQERNARGIESGQAAVQSAVQTAGQQTADVAKSAQTGFQSALTEIGSGLQRIASNNPNLVPDVKNLYQSASSKLSSTSASAAQSAQAAIPSAN